MNTRNNKKKLRIFKEYILPNKKALVGLIVIVIVALIALFAPLFAPYDPIEMETGPILSSPSIEHLMGTDVFGRDVFSRVLYGTRVSLLVGIIVSITTAIIGTPLGLIAGYYGGWVDNLIMRIADMIFSFPWILLAMIFAAIWGAGLNIVLIALPIIYAPQMTRLIRGVTLSIRKKEYVEAARLSKENDFSILLRYIMPNCVGPLIVQFTIIMAFAILAEAGISYLGLGTQPPTPSWGLMLSSYADYMMAAPYLSIFPGLSIMITVIGFNFAGDGLRDILDPRSRKQKK